jgi:AraC family transcriptional regulator
MARDIAFDEDAGGPRNIPGMEHAEQDVLVHFERIEGVIGTLRDSTESSSLEEMAEMACLSPFHFNHVFKRLIGIPPGAFQAALKMDRAKRLLVGEGASVTDVCFDVGFSSLGTFTTRFTDLVGVAPLKFRELPFAIEPALENILDRAEITRSPFPAMPGLSGRVMAPDIVPSLIFIGIFPQGIAQRSPASGTIILKPGPYQLTSVSDGNYVLLCAAIPVSANPTNWLAPGTDLWVGGGQTISVRLGNVIGDMNIPLRKYLPTDPPILVSPFVLLLTRLNRTPNRDS